ncbi:DUF3306 domain-containing protein [Ramlibacter sp.]|uniref:DUF3306 domain-containing protein n=1 Tax=Ramlibacter sp. TaxID=1917967 RepID=UPI003D0D2994
MSEEGFFSRWSKRKEAVREGRQVVPEPEGVARDAPSPQPSPAGGSGGDLASSPQREEAPPLPTLEEAQALTADADFTRFAARDVPPDVKNAAMKKLFSDPRFNVMDGLDTYIDDYSKPDPIPESMLRKLASAQFLDLFDEEKNRRAAEGREVADKSAAQTVAQSGDDVAEPVVPPDEDHADPDLRLQQDHAAGPEGPGHGTR